MSNVAFTIFGMDIYWYAIMIVSGIMAAMAIAAFLLKSKGYKPDVVIDFALLTLPLAIIGARLYYVLFTLDRGWTFGEIFLGIRDGGLAIYGGVIGGAIGVLLTCKIKKYKLSQFWDVADAIAPGLIFAQAVGRWGNFFNQEAHGAPVLDPSKWKLPYAIFVDGTIPGSSPVGWYQATFFYESMSNLFAAIVLFVLAYRLRGQFKGIILAGYLVLYGIIRVVIEGLRTDSLMWGNVRVSQLLSGLLILAGAAWIAYILVNDLILKPKKAAANGTGTIDVVAVADTEPDPVTAPEGDVPPKKRKAESKPKEKE